MKKKIVFVINSLGYGGAERVLGNLLNAAGERRERVDLHLVLLDRVPRVRAMPDFVVEHVLDGRGSLGRSMIQLHRLLLHLEPDLVVSFLVRANVASALAGRKLRCPIIVGERMHLSSHLAGRYRGLKLRLTRLLPRLAYRSASVVLGVSTGVTQDLVDKFAVPAARARTIFNPYDFTAIREAGAHPPEVELPRQFIVGVGRLERAKNFDLLIRAFAKARLPHSLVILGEGTERASLQRTVDELGIAHRVILPGYVMNPFAIVARADFYVSSSRNEGFPNAMVEAMALGIPVVATDCRSGPAEVLAGIAKLDCAGMTEVDHGILVAEDSEAAFTQALERMAEPGTRAHYSAQARERAAEFSIDRIAAEYWDLFEATAKPASLPAAR
ncbi:MAG: glycosyltransferase [Sphingomicrobium sp.]